MGSHGPFGHMQHKLCQKERSLVKLAIWLSTTKSQESTRPRCLQVECDTLLESSRWRLQLCFKPHRDQRSAYEVMHPQSPGTKSHLDVAPVNSCKVYYMGEGGGFPRVRAMVSFVSPELPVACPSTEGAPKSDLTNLLVGWMHIQVSNWKACHFS
jgi:hypothetical protein